MTVVLTTLLSILLWTLAVLGILLGLLLVMPISVRAGGQIDGETLAGELRASWALGLLGLRISSRRSSGFTLCGLRVARLPRRSRESTKPKRRAPDSERKKAEENKVKAKGKSGRGFFWALAHREGMKRAARRLLATLALRLEVRGQLGLGDPADTVVAERVVSTLGERLPGVRLEVAWDYLDDVVELDGEGRARIWPVHTLGVGLLLLLDREVRALLRSPAKAT